MWTKVYHLFMILFTREDNLDSPSIFWSSSVAGSTLSCSMLSWHFITSSSTTCMRAASDCFDSSTYQRNNHSIIKTFIYIHRIPRTHQHMYRGGGLCVIYSHYETVSTVHKYLLLVCISKFFGGLDRSLSQKVLPIHHLQLQTKCYPCIIIWLNRVLPIHHLLLQTKWYPCSIVWFRQSTK